MYNTWIFLKVIAINGFLPITFTLTNLYMVGILSWYMLVISTLTVALSIGTFAAVGTFNPSELEMQNLAKIADSGGPQECTYKQPGVYCYSSISDYSSSTVDSDATSILSFCLVVMFLLLGHRSNLLGRAPVRRLRRIVLAGLLSSALDICAFLRHLRSHRSTMIFASKTKKAARTCMKNISKSLNLFSKISTLAALEDALTALATTCNNSKASQLLAKWSTDIYFNVRERGQTFDWKGSARVTFKTGVFVLFLYLYIKFFTMFLGDLAWFARNDVYSKTWNFGQVVAITVWAPPICEYIHLEVRKSMQRSQNEPVDRSLLIQDQAAYSEASTTGSCPHSKSQETPTLSTIKQQLLTSSRRMIVVTMIWKWVERHRIVPAQYQSPRRPLRKKVTS